ncbi:MAG: hypothetical protein ACOYVK_16540 [Bacillota bacterium]
MSKHRRDCHCKDRDREKEKALLAKLDEEFCAKKCVLEEAIKECEKRCRCLKDELKDLERCYEKERKAIKRKFH